MDDDPIPRVLPALRALTGWFNEKQTPYAVIGGVAITLIARARSTRDIDAVVLIDESDPLAFISSGEKHGIFPREENPLERARTSRMMLLVHRPSGVSIDVSLGAIAFEHESLARAVTVRARGVDVRVPRVEDLIIMKAVASRPVDLGDIDGILDMHPDVDREGIRAALTEFAEILDKPEIVTNVEPLLNAKRLAR